MTTKRRLALTALVGTCALALFVGWMMFIHLSRSRRPRCQISVSTVGITNDAAGARYACFELSNVGQHAVSLLDVYALQNYSGEWRTDLMPKTAKTLHTNLMAVAPFGVSNLNPAESCRLTLLLPFDDSRWRATFYYREIWPPLAGDIDRLLNWLGWRKTEEDQSFTSTDWTEQ